MLIFITVLSDVTKETPVSKDTTDTASASPSVRKKETMAAVKTVSGECDLELYITLLSYTCE